MKSTKIKWQSAGAYFTAIISNEKHTIKPESSEARETIKKEIEKYNTLASDTRLKKIIKLLTPKKEAASTALVVKKKQVKNLKKTLKKSTKSDAVKEVEKIEEVIKTATPETVPQVAELARYQRYKGYVNPTTGRVWDGERYN